MADGRGRACCAVDRRANQRSDSTWRRLNECYPFRSARGAVNGTVASLPWLNWPGLVLGIHWPSCGAMHLFVLFQIVPFFFFLSHLKKIYIFRWKFFISSKYQWIESIVFIIIKYIFLCVNVESFYKNTRDYLILEYYIYSYSFMWYLNILINNFLRHMSIPI